MRRRAPSTSPPSGRTSTRSTCRTAWSRGSSAASTTTRGPRSSSTCRAATASSRPSAAAAATTGSSSCSAAGRRPGSGSGSGLDRVVLALAERGQARAADGRRGRRRRGADPADTVARLRIATDLRAAGVAARADLGHRKLGKQLESAARDQAHFAVIVGDELAAGDVQLRDLPAGTQKVVPLAALADGGRPGRMARTSTAPGRTDDGRGSRPDAR